MTQDITENQSNPQTRSRPRWGRILAWAALLSLLTLIFFALLRAQDRSLDVGEAVPEFTLTTFDGKTYTNQDLRGKVVLLNFWASWCKPCEQEASDMEAAWKTYQGRDDVIFLGVAWTDTDKKSLEYLNRFGITYPNGPDLGTRMAQSFRITGVPETFLIDKDGKLANFKFSPFLSVAEIQAMIDPLLED
jgi:cytochrome c biogenesis protein CcmG/thiol:disulfide interchange protein DsbE